MYFENRIFNSIKNIFGDPVVKSLPHKLFQYYSTLHGNHFQNEPLRVELDKTNPYYN